MIEESHSINMAPPFRRVTTPCHVLYYHTHTPWMARDSAAHLFTCHKRRFLLSSRGWVRNPSASRSP